MIAKEGTRPEPDALLAEAEQDGRGRLKIFLGMAPGVGKTFAMLDSARRLRAQGIDVIGGIIETHGRAETMALCEGLETLQRRRIVYRGQILEEFDIDAALARKPALLLVDELAHTNAPDCRHPKRWQDVQELIRAGIDVHTTLNVQHLESLCDVVTRITGVRVTETVPDHVLETADEIALIDLTPQELLTRLDDGKVYAPQLAGRARENFFKPGNLTALRELALRCAAERVDHQLVGYMRAHAIEGPWATSERIMALVGPDGLGSPVVRAANRIADQLKAPFVAVTVENPTRLTTPSADASVIDALALAERLNGRIDRLTGENLPGEILSYAHKNNITQIFVGQTRARWWREVLRRSLVGELIRRADGVAIHVVSESPERAKPSRASTVPDWSGALPYGLGLAGAGVVVLLGLAVHDLATGANIAMLFLAAVLFSAVTHGTRPAIVTSVAAFIAYNFFFTAPRYTLQVEHWHDLLALGVFLVVATTTGALTGRVRNQALAERARMIALRTLFDFSKRLGGKTTIDDLGHAVVLQIHRLTGHAGILLLPQSEDLSIRYAWPPEDELTESDLAAARWTQSHGEPAGAGTGTLPSSEWHFRPLKTDGKTRGVLGLQTSSAPQGDILETIDSVLDQGAVALDRISLAADSAAIHAMTETDRLRGALLSSISHDLRTPLTSILGSASALRRDLVRLTSFECDDLLAAIEEEAQRLNRFVQNLLDMTRLESGALSPKREWIDVEDAVDGAVRRLAREMRGRQIVREFSADLPPAEADPVLLETVIVNLLDNAVKHADGAIHIAGLTGMGRLLVSVTDDGAGVPSAILPRLFDKFYRGIEAPAAGVGLGLSICKGLVEAMGGTIAVESPVHDGRGARFTLSLKAGRRP
ncbi:MAG: sensor histidine kinase KdpD [Alphaproteobacteria bacterium]